MYAPYELWLGKTKLLIRKRSQMFLFQMSRVEREKSNPNSTIFKGRMFENSLLRLKPNGFQP